MAKKTIQVAVAAIGALSGAFMAAEAVAADAGTEATRPAETSVMSTDVLNGDSVLANSIRSIVAQGGTTSESETSVTLAQFWNSAPPSVELAESWGSAPPSVELAQSWGSAPPSVELAQNWSSAPPSVEI